MWTTRRKMDQVAIGDRVKVLRFRRRLRLHHSVRHTISKKTPLAQGPAVGQWTLRKRDFVKEKDGTKYRCVQIKLPR